MEHKLVAARDEAIATEEGELAISSQMKSEEMLFESVFCSGPWGWWNENEG